MSFHVLVSELGQQECTLAMGYWQKLYPHWVVCKRGGCIGYFAEEFDLHHYECAEELKHFVNGMRAMRGATC